MYAADRVYLVQLQHDTQEETELFGQSAPRRAFRRVQEARIRALLRVAVDALLPAGHRVTATVLNMKYPEAMLGITVAGVGGGQRVMYRKIWPVRRPHRGVLHTDMVTLWAMDERGRLARLGRMGLAFRYGARAWGDTGPASAQELVANRATMDPALQASFPPEVAHNVDQLRRQWVNAAMPRRAPSTVYPVP